MIYNLDVVGKFHATENMTGAVATNKQTNAAIFEGHAFADGSLLAQALSHRSAGSPHNERLEFLGDALLNLIIAEQLYRAGPRRTKAR